MINSPLFGSPEMGSPLLVRGEGTQMAREAKGGVQLPPLKTPLKPPVKTSLNSHFILIVSQLYQMEFQREAEIPTF